MIDVTKIWLFETEVLDPLFFGTVDGVTVTMKDERTIELLDIALCEYMLTGVVDGGLEWSASNGGEDDGALRTLGKKEFKYELSFNVPLYSGRIIEEMVGRQFSVLGQRRSGTRFVVFGQFESIQFNIDNDTQNRITLKTDSTSAKLYNVNSLNIQAVKDEINIGSVCANIDNAGRMYYDFFPTTNIPASLTILSTMFTSAVVGWDKSLGANGYRLEWSEDGVNFPNVIIIDGGAITSYEIEGLPYNDTFYVRILATGDSVNSAYSPIVSGSTQMLLAPENYTTTNYAETTADASWDLVDGADGYQIEWGTDGVTFPNVQAVGNVSSAEIIGLDSGSEITSRVRSLMGVNEGEASNESAGNTLSNSFIFTVDATDDTFTFPQRVGELFTGDIIWDGVLESFVDVDGGIFHDFGSTGIKTVEILGANIQPRFNNGLDKDKFLDISNCGSVIIGAGSFRGCTMMTWSAIDAPTLSSDMTACFNNCDVLESNTSWEDWDFSVVTDMEGMFGNSGMINPHCTTWDVSNATSMRETFRNCPMFNRDISLWNTSSVASFRFFLRDTTSFDQNIGSLDLSNASDLIDMLNNAGLSTENYNRTLDGWSNQVLPFFLTLGAQGLVADGGNPPSEPDGLAARTSIINSYFWTIIDSTPP